MLFLPWMDFPWGVEGALPPSLPPSSLSRSGCAASAVMDHWVPVMDLPCVWLSPEGHGVGQGAIVNEEPEGQMPLLFPQSWAMRCDAVPKKDELSWASQRTDIWFPTQQGSCQKQGDA